MANCRLTVFSSFFFFSCVAYCSTPLCHVYCIYTLPSTFGPGEIEATMPPYLLLVTGNDIARIERQSRWQQVSLVSVTMSFFSMYLYLCIPTGSWGGTKRKRFWFALLNCSIELDKVRNKGNKSGNPASSETLLKGRVGPPINNFRRRCYFHVSLALSLSLAGFRWWKVCATHHQRSQCCEILMRIIWKLTPSILCLVFVCFFLPNYPKGKQTK